MELQRVKDGIFSIKFSRNFTLESAPLFAAITISLEKKSVKAVILDMECLEVIDSTSIKCLDNFIKTLRQRDIGVATIKAPKRIREILLYKGVNMFFDNNPSL